MINISYEYSKIKLKDLKKFEKKIKNIVEQFEKGTCLGNDFIGWKDYASKITELEIDRINKSAEKIRGMANVFVVCGIGGSYLGARAVIEAIKGYINRDNIEILYLGNTFDEKYTLDVLNYLKDKDFCVNVISKSGTTLETAYAFRMLKSLLEEKYGDEAKQRIFATTDPEKGCLRLIAEENNYEVFNIPSNIGGRYSVFTPVGLLPLSVAGVDIKEFLKGAIKAEEDFKIRDFEKNPAYQYASYRYLQYKKHKNLEIFSTYSPYLTMVSEWWKQLFGESEGKNNKGLFPASVTFSTDLHSLGQFIQQGKKSFFMTQLYVDGTNYLYLKEDKDDKDNLNYLSNTSLNEINHKAQTGTNLAHYNFGKNDIFTINIDKIEETNLGYLLYMLMYSCMISAYLLGVNPFNQPGVEFYKSEMKKLLKK